MLILLALILSCPDFTWDAHDGDIPDYCGTETMGRIYQDFGHAAWIGWEDFGWDMFHPCPFNPNGLHGRFVNGVWVLYNPGGTGGWLANGYNYVVARHGWGHGNPWIPQCVQSAVVAATYLQDDGPTLIYYDFGDYNPIIRASILVHEARHTEGYTHIANWQCWDNASCDESWEYNGANHYGLQWLADFLVYSNFGSQEARTEAQLWLTDRLQRSFRVPPDVTFIEGQGLIGSCRTACGIVPNCLPACACQPDGCPPPDCTHCFPHCSDECG